MFCPKCATQNNDGAKFCRSCGIDISLIPQAMVGQVPAALDQDEETDRDSRRARRRNKAPSVEKGIRSFFSGVGFLCVALILSYSRMGTGWWYWMLIPAFSMIGGGIAEYVGARHARKEFQQYGDAPKESVPRSPRVEELPARRTSELVPQPPSVTEGTTRHLGAEGATKIFVPANRPGHDG